MTFLQFIDTVRPGMPIADLLSGAAAFGPAAVERDASDPGHVMDLVRFADEDVKAFVDLAKGVVTTVKYGPGFRGDVRGVRLGMTGPEVVALLGRADRNWPMPHPDIVLLYDHPRFLRVDVDRATKRVIAIFR